MKISKSLAKVSAGVSSVFAGLYLASAGFAKTANEYIADMKTGNSMEGRELEELIFGLINWAIAIAAVVSVVVLVAAGYMFITAAGDEGKVEKATKTLTFAIIGLVVCFISVILVQFVVKNVLGIN
jgi:cytochrome bd-type quinol oxidase subunit 2